jgi:dTDP-4-amino-4,6-dideoxy-D-galactose acyltransferase
MIDYLDWDSNFFGYNVGRIKELTYDIRAIKDYAVRHKFKLIYLFNECPLKAFELASFDNIVLVDEKVTFLQKIDSGYLKPEYSQDMVQRIEDFGLSLELIKLAIQSGKYSRFKKDKNITDNKFRELYKVWIEESIKNTMADEVWGWLDSGVLQGMITLSKKENRGDIGLIAVNHLCRGKGIGRVLINKALEFTSRKGLSELQVVTQRQNSGACSFYKSCNFFEEKHEYVYHIWI